jgi:hypothetical protein
MGCRSCFRKRRFRGRLSAQRGDSVEQLSAVPERRDAKFLQVLSRQARKNRLVDLVLAECRLIPFEAKAPQPTPDVRGGVLIPAREQ